MVEAHAELKRRIFNTTKAYPTRCFDTSSALGMTCVHCERTIIDHPENKCLFGPTTWKPMTYDEAMDLLYGANRARLR